MDASDKSDLEAKSNALKQAVSGNDVADIKSRTEELQKALYAVSEKLYKAAAPQGGQPAADNAGAPAQDTNGNPVYDAEYKDVDDNNNK